MTDLQQLADVARLAKSKAPATPEEFLPYLRAAIQYWSAVETDAIDRDDTRVAFTATGQRLEFEASFQKLGRKFNPQTDGITSGEVDALPVPIVQPPTSIPERGEPDVSLTAVWNSSHRGGYGTTLRSKTRWTFSTRWQQCPWVRQHEYGPDACRVLEEWEALRTQVIPGWGQYQGDDFSAREAAYQAAEDAVSLPLPAPHRDQFAILVSRDCSNLVDWLLGRRVAFGRWPTEAEARRYIYRWESALFTRALAVAEKFLPAVPGEVLRRISFRGRLEAAESRDKESAAQFPADDGPEYVVVVKNEVCHGYEEDPQCFSGDRWVTVSPPKGWHNGHA
jgi:hypothetical protein